VATPQEDAQEAELAVIANRVAATLDADVLLYNGPIANPLDRNLASTLRKRRRRKNVLLILVTLGGEADSAYRIAKALQSKYEKFILYVTGYCKSAGTLIALGANELVIGDDGELGPLDVQMSKQDTLWETQSGLTVNASLTALQSKAYLAFEEFFMQTESNSGGAITVKTAAEIATNLTVGLFAPLYAQIDPLHVGEAARAMQIAEHYGRLLLQEGKNLDRRALDKLVTEYPAHGFVIGRDEASRVFKSVREPTEDEVLLAETVGIMAQVPHEMISRTPRVEFLSTEREQPKVEEQIVQVPSEDVKIVQQARRSNVDGGLADGAIKEEDHNGRTGTGVPASADRPVTQPGA
jgi:hypothetical protein